MSANLTKLRWGIRGVLVLGVAASTTANVLHANPNPISQSIAAWPPLALLITIEVVARVPVHRRGLAAARLTATAVIAGIAAWVSYWHMAGVASKFGESGASPYLLPLSVDGLIVVASICLVELGGRIRDSEPTPAVAPGPVFDHAEPIGPQPLDKLSTPKAAPRKPHPSAEQRVQAAHKRTPTAGDEVLAKRLNLSTKTVRRHRPKPAAGATPINGRDPELVGAGHDKKEN